MPEIPLSDSPRHSRLLPLGVAVETLATARPSAGTLERARELAERVKDGDRDEAVAELARHAASIEARPPALMLVLDALLDSLLPQGDSVSVYAGRLFYCLHLQERPDPRPVAAESQDLLRDNARDAISASFRHGGASSLEETLKQGLERGVLEALWREGASATVERGLGWLTETWLAPYALDYAAEQSGVELDPLNEEDVYRALAGHAKLIEDEQEMQLLHVQMVKRSVVPRLLARRWPLLLEAAEELLAQEPLLASSRQDFADITAEARRLRDEAEARAAAKTTVAKP